MTKKKSITDIIRSSTAEYLTYIASSGGDSENLEILYQDENIWLTQKMIASLYDISIPAINQHIKTIFDNNKLAPDSDIKEYLTTAKYFLIVQKERSV